MCNLYSITRSQDAMRRLFAVTEDLTGNLAPMPGVFPDMAAPVVCEADGGRRLEPMRWGMPGPPQFGGAPVTNIRKAAKKLRSLFARRYCLGTYVAFPPWTNAKAYRIELRRLEREVQDAAPFALPWLGERNFENTVEPRAHVDALLKELSWPADRVVSISRQAAKCPHV